MADEWADTAFVIIAIGHEDTDCLYSAVLVPLSREAGLKPYRVDVHSCGENIFSSIFDGIRSAKLIIADLTYARPNCYAEVGYALGMGRQRALVLTARKDHDPRAPNPAQDPFKVHFDLDQYPIQFWDPGEFDSFRVKATAEIKLRLERLAAQMESTSAPSAPGLLEVFDEDWLAGITSQFLELLRSARLGFGTTWRSSQNCVSNKGTCAI